ncbi:MAG TPA: M56 family metallopeptidase [Candidatus Aquilonibacter sp.]|nr:M56 family metallopeptidase [Candidatus Aquilonibacter sp.]
MLRTTTFGITFGMQAIAESSALRIVDCLFAGTLIAAFAGVMSHFSRRQSSAVRFALWFSALIGVAASPFLSGMSWVRSGNVSAGIARPAIMLPGSWAPYLLGAWAVIASWFLIRLGVGLFRLRLLRDSFVPVDVEALDPQVRETLNRACGRQVVSLCASERIQVPAAVGLLKPVVVVPRWALEELSADDLSQVLLHELAHLRRRDGWTNLAQQVIKALFFFHPAVWWIERNISLEREMACDDAVLAETANARAYAECLRHIAEKTLLRRSLALAQAVLGRMRQTSMRVAQILDPRHPRGAKHGWKTALSLTTLVIVCGLVESSEPHLIAFRDGEPSTRTIAAAQYDSPTITPVSFRTSDFNGAEPIASKPVSHSTRVHLLATKSIRANGINASRGSQLVAASARRRSLLHLASVRSRNTRGIQVVASEAVFVIFENTGYNPNGQPIYEIEVLHVTVLQPSITLLNNENPLKKI